MRQFVHLCVRKLLCSRSFFCKHPPDRRRGKGCKSRQNRQSIDELTYIDVGLLTLRVTELCVANGNVSGFRGR